VGQRLAPDRRAVARRQRQQDAGGVVDLRRDVHAAIMASVDDDQGCITQPRRTVPVLVPRQDLTGAGDDEPQPWLRVPVGRQPSATMASDRASAAPRSTFTTPAAPWARRTAASAAWRHPSCRAATPTG